MFLNVERGAWFFLSITYGPTHTSDDKWSGQKSACYNTQKYKSVTNSI